MEYTKKSTPTSHAVTTKIEVEGTAYGKGSGGYVDNSTLKGANDKAMNKDMPKSAGANPPVNKGMFKETTVSVSGNPSAK